jgi:hypothetical protein
MPFRVELCLNPLQRIGGKLPLKRVGKWKDMMRKLIKLVKQMKHKLRHVPGLEKQVSGYFHINKELYREIEGWKVVVAHRDNRIAQQAAEIQVLRETLRGLGITDITADITDITADEK